MQDDPRWYLADPICTFLFAALVLLTTRAILRDISDVLMERVPRGLSLTTFCSDLTQVGPSSFPMQVSSFWTLPSIQDYLDNPVGQLLVLSTAGGDQKDANPL